MFRRFVAGFVALATCVVVAPAAVATGLDPLPLAGFGQILVDDARQRVYLSGGASSNTVVALDSRGRVVKKADGQFGATGLVLSADGKTLFAALATGDAISAISTETFKETARYSTGPQTCPVHLARTGGILWFGYGCADAWTGGVGRLDPAATAPVSLNEQGEALFQNAPLVRAAGDTVVAGQLATSLSSTWVYRAENGALTRIVNGEVAGSNLTDLSLTATGSTLFTAAGSRAQVQAFATESLAAQGAYDSGHSANAVTISKESTHVATGAYTSRPKAVLVYRLGQTTAVRSYELDGYVLADRGLAFSADEKSLYAVVQGANDPRPRLVVLSRPFD